MIFSLRKQDGIGRSASFDGVFENWRTGNEKFLFISPHDDDVCIGAGLLLQEAASADIPVRIIVVTDGNGGYCDASQRSTIGEIRKRETLESYRFLGVNDICFLDYPDGDLTVHAGRRTEGGPDRRQDCSGLQNSFTAVLRDFRPTRLFVMSDADYHPDHKTVYAEMMISIFHAAGAIWPELGPPAALPFLYEMAAYCNFRVSPDLQLEGSEEDLETKLDAVACYKSQKQIKMLVDNLRTNGPYEYFTARRFDLYDPAAYRGLFT